MDHNVRQSSCVAKENGSDLGSELCQRLCNAVGTLGEGVKFENTHGAIPNDCLGALQSILECLQGVRAYVQALQCTTALALAQQTFT